MIKRLTDYAMNKPVEYIKEFSFYILLGVYIFLVMTFTMMLMKTDWVSSNLFS